MRRRLPHIPLWIQWTLATTLSIAWVWVLWEWVFRFSILESLGIYAIAIPLLTFLPLGVSQWAILRRRIRHAIWWIPATTLGTILGLVGGAWSIYFIEHIYIYGALSLALCTFVGGAILGFLQWLILRVSCKRAYWWIVASGIGWLGSVSWLVFYSMRFFVSSLDEWETTVWPILGGASGGAIKGIALTWILGKSRKDKALDP